MVTVLIIFFASLAYVFGVYSMFKKEYKPSIYSRLVWFLIGVNSFFGVLALKNSAQTIILAIIATLGMLIMFLGALRFSVKTFGKTELICTILLLISVVLWITVNNPIISLILGLVAHFIGGIPSLKQVIKDPHSEFIPFWLSFGVASLLVFIQADKSSINLYLYPLYFMAFDILMSGLAARKYLKHW